MKSITLVKHHAGIDYAAVFLVTGEKVSHSLREYHKAVTGILAISPRPRCIWAAKYLNDRIAATVARIMGAERVEFEQ